MSKHIRGTIGFVQSVENFLVHKLGWFVLEHDGEKGTDIAKMGKPSFFTRLYRMRLPDRSGGELVNTWIKFIYNYRDNWADFTLSWNNPIGERASVKEINSRRLVNAIKAVQEVEPTEEAVKGITKEAVSGQTR